MHISFRKAVSLGANILNLITALRHRHLSAGCSPRLFTASTAVRAEREEQHLSYDDGDHTQIMEEVWHVGPYLLMGGTSIEVSLSLSLKFYARILQY